MFKEPYDIIDLERHSDPRGNLFEILRFKDHKIPGEGYVYCFTINYKQRRGDHYHTKKQEWFSCVSGKAVVLVEDRIGFGCELIVPKRHRYPNTGENNILEYYNIKTPFRVTELISPDLIDIDLGPFLNKFIFWIQQLFFAFSLKKYLAGREGMVYSRDQFALSVLSSKKFKLYWEAHNLPQNINSGFYRNILSKIKGLAVISEGLKNDFAEYYKGPMVVAPDAVDIEIGRAH